MPEALVVPYWPALASWGQIRLCAIITPASPQRAAARLTVRSVLRQLLASHFSCAEATLVELPGQPVRVAEGPFAIAISHEAGLSLLAVQPAGQLGIDLMLEDAAPDQAAERRRIADEYFGIATPAVEASRRAFAEAWTAHEARLKCCGQALDEANRCPGVPHPPLTVRQLLLPAPYIGALASRATGPDDSTHMPPSQPPRPPL